MSIEEKIAEMGIQLPVAPNPMANYVSAQRVGNLLFFSGAGPLEDGKPKFIGKVGSELTLEEGKNAARLTALNLVSVIKREIGNLDKVKQIVKLLAFVASGPEFTQQPSVVDGASDVLVEIFGERGKHARSAVAAPILPFNIPVEIEMIVELY